MCSYYNAVSVVGTAVYPEYGTTNLHLDMSDAVNVMVSVALSIYIVVEVCGTFRCMLLIPEHLMSQVCETCCQMVGGLC